MDVVVTVTDGSYVGDLTYEWIGAAGNGATEWLPLLMSVMKCIISQLLLLMKKVVLILIQTLS